MQHTPSGQELPDPGSSCPAGASPLQHHAVAPPLHSPLQPVLQLPARPVSPFFLDRCRQVTTDTFDVTPKPPTRSPQGLGPLPQLHKTLSGRTLSTELNLGYSPLRSHLDGDASAVAPIAHSNGSAGKRLRTGSAGAAGPDTDFTGAVHAAVENGSCSHNEHQPADPGEEHHTKRWKGVADSEQEPAPQSLEQQGLATGMHSMREQMQSCSQQQHRSYNQHQQQDGSSSAVGAAGQPALQSGSSHHSHASIDNHMQQQEVAAGNAKQLDTDVTASHSTPIGSTANGMLCSVSDNTTGTTTPSAVRGVTQTGTDRWCGSSGAQQQVLHAAVAATADATREPSCRSPDMLVNSSTSCVQQNVSDDNEQVGTAVAAMAMGNSSSGMAGHETANGILPSEATPTFDASAATDPEHKDKKKHKLKHGKVWCIREWQALAFAFHFTVCR